MMDEGAAQMSRPPFRLVAGLRELGNAGRCKPANDRDPTALSRLPRALIFASRVSPVDQLVAVGGAATDGDG